MIVEGIITTQDHDGNMHVSPIGPHVDRSLQNWVLKPFKSSTTFSNLHRTNQGVFHILDDGLILIESVLGLSNTTPHRPKADYLPGVGWVLADACRAFPLKIVQWDTAQERAVAVCMVAPCIELRPFWGWNRAAHSLLELAVLWSRRHLLPGDELHSEFERHRTIIIKTAGDRELAALGLLESALKDFALDAAI